MAAHATSRLASARDLVQREGVWSLVRSVAIRIRVAAVLHERHVWHVLVLGDDAEQTELANDLRIERVGSEGLDPYLELPTTVTAREANRRLEAGAELWLTSADGEPAFACWLFRGRAPVLAAPDGWLELPANAVVLEDSVASPAHRGRGLAPTTWTVLAERLRRDDVEFLLTKVELHNVPSHKALAKAGFEPTALMSHRRALGWHRVTVDPFGRLAGAPAVDLLRACER